jgi:hypothetical protein
MINDYQTEARIGNRYNPAQLNDTGLGALMITMTRFLIVSLLICSMPARAGWEQVIKNPRGDVYYLDNEILQKGTVHQVWSLVDLIEPIEKSASVKRLYEADCVKGKLRVVQKLVYSGKGGQGTMLSTDKKPGRWVYPDPASVNEELMLRICFGGTGAKAGAKKEIHSDSSRMPNPTPEK